MPQSTRFPVALHILISLTLRPDEWMNSESLAWSINTNASMVRRILSSLGRAGLVTSQAGISGGAKLALDPDRITLLDVYRAVHLKPKLGVHAPNEKCPLGAVLEEPLRAILDETDAAAERVLSEKTISEIAELARKRIVKRARKAKKAATSRRPSEQIES